MPETLRATADHPGLVPVVAFVDRLRTAGLAVPVGATVTFAESLGVLDASVRDDVYWAGRATLVTRPEDAGVYDRVFAETFGGEVTLTLAVPDPAVV